VTVKEFLTKYGMNHETVDIEKCCGEFMEDMKKGLAGEKSSLMMLPAYVGLGGDVPLNETVIVMDAGGTNFRVVSFHFNDEKKPVIEDFKVYPMPGSKGTITKAEFFETVADYLEPVVDKSDKVGFCFSYPTEILPNMDGRLIEFNKEVHVTGSEGMIVGEGINEVLKARGKSPKKFILLNDTVAAMLGGVMAYPDRCFDSYIGFILGTGTNTCYVEKGENIVKIKTDSKLMAINMESGDYNKMPRGEIDRLYDQGTDNPGAHTYEKEVSGAYQGGVIHQTILKAMEEGLFSDAFCEAYKKLPELSMRSIDDFCFYPYGKNPLSACCGENEADRTAAYQIIDESFERAAKLVCVNISSILMFTGNGKSPLKPVCVAAEGTTFYKSKLFRGKLDYYIRSFLNDKHGLYCEFVKAENANLVGSAIAALLN
jgi:hexokinase